MLRANNKWTKPRFVFCKEDNLSFWAPTEEPEHFGDDELPRNHTVAWNEFLKSTVFRVLTRAASRFLKPAVVYHSIHGGTIRVTDRKSQIDRSEIEKCEDPTAVDPNLHMDSGTVGWCARLPTSAQSGMVDAAASPLSHQAQKARIRAAYPPRTN
ncbi:hypothetical protein Tco_1156464 [Tanacetum coccineum]